MKPVHPIVVHFPIALLTFSVIADFAGIFTHSSTLHYAGWWTLFGAAIMGVFTVAAGLFDMQRAKIPEAVHPRVHRHMHVGIVLLLAIIGLAFWRWTFFKSDSGLSFIYLAAAGLAVALAAFQGWLGGELVYTDGVSVATREADAKAPAHAASAHDGGSNGGGEHGSGHSH